MISCRLAGGLVALVLPALSQILGPVVGSGKNLVAPVPCVTPVFVLVQQRGALTGVCSTCMVGLTSAPTAGDMVSLIISARVTSGGIAPAISSVTSANTTWTKDGSQSSLSGGAGGDSEIWHGIAAASAGATITVVFNITLAGSGLGYNVAEWSGNSAAPADGAIAAASSTSTTAATNPYSTTGTTCELILGTVGSPSAVGISTSPGPPYTNMTTTGIYNLSAPLGGQSQAIWGLTFNATWNTLMQGYKHL